MRSRMSVASIRFTRLNNTITNNNPVQNNKTDISNLKAGFNLKAGATTSQVKLGEATTPTIEFATADDTMTVNLSDKKVTYGIDKNKLINNINNTTNNPVTNSFLHGSYTRHT